jgi:hypothetical protein
MQAEYSSVLAETLTMFTRQKSKRVVDMTNEEAAEHYAARAREAWQQGELSRAKRLFQTALLHDPDNAGAREGFAATKDAPTRRVARAATDTGSAHLRHYHRPWWKKLLKLR